MSWEGGDADAIRRNAEGIAAQASEGGTRSSVGLFEVAADIRL